AVCAPPAVRLVHRGCARRKVAAWSRCPRERSARRRRGIGAVTAVAPIEIAPGIKLGGAALPFIVGPCMLESEALALAVARHVAAVAAETGIQVVFKGSFDKANRTSINSYRGPGLQEGLRILASVEAHTGLPVTTDVHEIA